MNLQPKYEHKLLDQKYKPKKKKKKKKMLFQRTKEKL